MCGICGIFEPQRESIVERSTVKAMADQIRHRGPDDDGFYTGPGIGLGHRRLSIIDVHGGHQPLSNEDGTIWIAFNGEIYNFEELNRQYLSTGHTFKTRCDTETIVHLYEELGDACLAQLRGMFPSLFGMAGARGCCWLGTVSGKSRCSIHGTAAAWCLGLRSRPCGPREGSLGNWIRKPFRITFRTNTCLLQRPFIEVSGNCDPRITW